MIEVALWGLLCFVPLAFGLAWEFHDRYECKRERLRALEKQGRLPLEHFAPGDLEWYNRHMTLAGDETLKLTAQWRRYTRTLQEGLRAQTTELQEPDALSEMRAWEQAEPIRKAPPLPTRTMRR